MLFKIVYKNQIHVMTSQELITFEKFDTFIKSVFKRLPSKFTLIYKDNDDDFICLANNADMKALAQSGLQKVKIEIQECNGEDFYDQTQQIDIDESFNIEIPPIEETQPSIQESQEKLLPNNSTYSEQKSLDDSIQEAISKMLPTIILQIKEEFEQNKIGKSILFDSKKIPKIVTEVHSNNVVVHKGFKCDGCKVSPIVGIRYKCVICSDFDFCEKCENSCSHEHPFLKIRKLKHNPLKIIAVIEDEEDSLEYNGERVPCPGIQQGIQFIDQMMGGRRCRKDIFSHCKKGWKKFAHGLAKKDEQSCSEKIEAPEENNEILKVESNIKQDKNQPIIIDTVEIVEIVEQPKQEEQKEEIVVEEALIFDRMTQDLIFGEAAGYISDMMEIEYNEAYNFVINHPGLTKEEILMKYIGN